jgi:hypothetical protein
MASFVLVCGLLSLPAGHQVVSHRVLQRGHEPTRHELRHRARSRLAQRASDVGWLLYCAGAVAVALVLR